MKIDLLNVDKWVELNGLKEISSANVISGKSSEPDPEGLASYDIFGRPGSTDRKRSYAYINLVNKFIHPHCYYELLRLQRNLRNLIDGLNEFYLDKPTGKLIQIKSDTPVPTGVKKGTGINFLYSVWNDLKFEVTAATAPGTAARYKFFSSLKRDDVFISKLPVIPPFYRDIDTQNKKKHELNVMYTKFITNASALKSTSGLFEAFGMSTSDKKIQDSLLTLYEYFVNIIGGTKGFIHKHVMGKSTDYSARLVISMPRYDNNTIDESEVSFEYSALPLNTTCKCFAPFIEYGIKKIVENVLNGSNFINVYKNGTITRKELAPDYQMRYSSQAIEKMIQLYDSSLEHRLDIFTLPCTDGSEVPLMYINEHKSDSILDLDLDRGITNANKIKKSDYENKRVSDIHPINLTELLYMAAYDTVRDKCIEITRYPIEDQNNIYPSKFNIIPTVNRKKMIVMGTEYPNFPIIPKEIKSLNYIFVDSLRIFPSYLKALGGDFDGDQVSIQGIFTNEANATARAFITSKLNVLNVSGSTMREFSEVAQVGLYNLTYRFKS